MKVTVSIKQKSPGLEKKLEKIYATLTKKEVAVGFPIGKDGLSNPHYKNGASIIEVAVYTNFHHGFAFMEKAAQKIQPWFKDFMKQEAKALVNGNMKIEVSLEKAGAAAAGIVQETITDITEPPNQPATIKRKKSSNPLIDTGAMRAAVTYAVRNKK